MEKQLAFYFDASACTGCKACAIACKDRSDLPVGINWRKVYQYEGGGWVSHPENKDLLIPSNLFVYSVSTACMHCEKPICMEVCPATAITKREDGVVLIDNTKCIGCRYCEWACPYGAVQFNEEKGYMTKCDFCQDLQAKGQKPVCVDACVMRVLDVGELDELRAKYGNVSAIEPLPTSDLTEPAVVITPHKHAQTSGSGTGHILSVEES
ncbi:MAG: dimethylsulfoxide reductase subunit B [Anaerolineales bacterium]|nr:MAG: dimethylsulfoxide reductase subunit B [Anaerolineales bacterium]